MDVFSGVDIDAIRRKIDAGVGLGDLEKKEKKEKKVYEAKLGAQWSDSKGLLINIPESMLNDMGWNESTKIEMMMHDNVLILYPLNGFLNLRKISGKTGKSILIPKDNFKAFSKMSEMAEKCKIWADDVTCYHRLMLQFPSTIPQAFSH